MFTRVRKKKCMRTWDRQIMRDETIERDRQTDRDDDNDDDDDDSKNKKKYKWVYRINDNSKI